MLWGDKTAVASGATTASRQKVSTTEILSVEPLAGDALRGSGIELPAAGDCRDEYGFEVAGWVLSASSPAVQVEIIANDGVPRRFPIEYPRPDVAREYPGTPESTKAGFWSRISVIGMTTEFELTVRAVLEDTTRVPLGVIRGRRQALPSSFRASIQPLMVNSLARTGTTWIMRLLAAHPAITAVEIYPYEVRPAKYWMQLMGAMIEPAHHAQSESKLGILEEEWWSQQDPFVRGSLAQNRQLQHWLNSRFVEKVARLCQQSAEDTYREVATLQGKASVTYFAEKHIPDEVPGIIWELYPGAREVFVVRNFRDMLCSIRAFNRKRGIVGFNRDQVRSEDEYIRRLGREAIQLLGNWRARKQRAILVRYEDLIRQPLQTLQPVFHYLGVDASTPRVEKLLETAALDTPELAGHRTSSSVGGSIARWREDLDRPTQELCARVFGESLREFGYQV
jgi:hypothetical protein